MKYLIKMNSLADYQLFVEGGGSDYVEPHVVYIPNDDLVKYKQFVPPPPVAGDIAYWDGSAVQLVSKTAWNSNLGTPVGVVVIPPNMLPDGKCRILALKGVDENGNIMNNYRPGMVWSNINEDTSLTNYRRVPTTDNSGSTTTGTSIWGRLPSDNFSGAQSFVDPKAYYDESNYLIPSPYLGNDTTLNPDYCVKTCIEYNNNNILYNNILSDFNGLSNTQTLVGLGTGYIAANACWKYKDGVSNLQWYLPAMGELGFMIVRLKEITNTLSMLGALVDMEIKFWSSTEYYYYQANGICTYNGEVFNYNKDVAMSMCLCPFAAF